ncbi:hypothetical protein [Seohaeicola zhoushanensis]|uniref:PA14 domain-containing protein n=1 Tax=Seohaeicola zhoushanensis TaxID=1569283 RepID=A0A8J3M7U5_9RHOB|nr:hypothetical protein [Seohaeicola zhoushanensis]GHF48594.1 hypothetical protein GCM10017056_20180 [Seohaeicola zhoushanensis]
MSRLAAAVCIIAMIAAPALAAPLKLKPADPQPSPKPGLSVTYAYPEEVKSLSEAANALKAAPEGGTPLSGLDYADTSEGAKTLTSKRAMHVAARIRGFVRFDAAGIYDIEFLTNDGIDARVGGQQVGLFDGRQSCDGTTVVQVEVPSAGWYPLNILYFQRLGTACLHMKMGPTGGKRNWMPNSAFGR